MHPCPRSDASCRLQSLGPYHDDTGRGQAIEVKRCSTCDIAFTCPELADLSELYADRTSNDFHPDDGALARYLKNIAFRREARSILKGLPAQPRVTMDFGCGDGRITNALSVAMGNSATVVGADFQQSAPDEILRENIAQYTSYDEAEKYAHKCDFVVSRHTLEHAADPMKFLDELKSYLTEDGFLFVEVPNSKTPWARIFGKHWEAWYTPFHRTHFSRRSLRECMERAGFEIVDEAGADMPLMGRTIRNITGGSYNILFFLVGLALHPIQCLVGMISRQPVCLRVLARNPSAAVGAPA